MSEVPVLILFLLLVVFLGFAIVPDARRRARRRAADIRAITQPVKNARHERISVPTFKVNLMLLQFTIPRLVASLFACWG